MAVCLESDESILLGSAYTAPAMPPPSKKEIDASARAVREWVAMHRQLKQRRDALWRACQTGKGAWRAMPSADQHDACFGISGVRSTSWMRRSRCTLYAVLESPGMVGRDER